MSEKTGTGSKYISLHPRGFSFFDIRAAFLKMQKLLKKQKPLGTRLKYIISVSLKLFKRNIKKQFL